jgi:hypothetical protein
MSQADLQTLQIHPDAADPALAEQQARFNGLVRDVTRWRAALREWQERMVRYQQAVEPVRRELQAAWRQWVLTLDHASLQPGLSRAEREQIGQLLRETSAALLELEDDAEIAAVASRHAKDTASMQARPQDAAAGAVSGQEPLEDETQHWEQQAAVAAARRAEWAAQRRAASALKRRRKEEQEVSRSLRDVYRRLAGTLHPDREPDERQRARKTALMQRANQAYAEENLLALLELQLEAEQLDAAHLASVDRRRLQHYVIVLQEQLADLQSETRRLEAEFRAATGLAGGSGLQSRKADRTITSEAQRLRSELLLLRRQAKSLLEVESMRTWLREQRKG